MPKRPCALALTEDDATIIAADKFGDVYSLPLLFSESENQTAANGSSPSSQASGTTAPKPFVPAASDLTVHSQRNLKALENQKRQTNQPPEKSEPTFEHKLLLGHVSMLTDVVRVSFQGRSYIISADRDEHIRVSRGIPQAHIIEGFCLGHTEFVSRLCVPDERSNLLISGGGDDYLFVWNWLSGTLVSKVDLKAAVEVVMRELETENHSSGPADHVKVAVSGISHARLPGENGVEDIIIAISEG
jgi:tRNA (guanine-N(7)-)-methyltransferase subunit TRM82